MLGRASHSCWGFAHVAQSNVHVHLLEHNTVYGFRIRQTEVGLGEVIETKTETRFVRN